jgi:hypothetical protein
MRVAAPVVEGVAESAIASGVDDKIIKFIIAIIHMIRF